MKILVTGGAGYIGSKLVPSLLMDGHQVTVLDNFMYADNSLGGLFESPNLTVSVGDVRDTNALRSLVDSADAVIPLAGLVGAPVCSAKPWEATQINLDAQLNLFGMVSREQIVIMPTTNSAYGSGSAGEVFDEKSPLNPISQYASDKVSVESALMQLPNAVSLRLATVFGMSPRMRLDLLVNDFTLRALRDRFIVLFEHQFVRNFIHVTDVVRAMSLALSRPDEFCGEVFNVGLSSANLSKLELCEKIREHVPEFEVSLADVGQDPDQRNYIVSNQKIEARGFAPSFSIDAGIKELVRGLPCLRVARHRNA